MATLDELQAHLAALTQRVNEITAPPDDYYTHRFSGEEIDNAVDRVEATPGSGAITAGDIGAAPSGFGLGAVPTLIKDFNEAIKPGWYQVDSNTVNGPNIHAVYHDIGSVFVTRHGDRIIQMFFGYAPGGIVYVHWLLRAISGDRIPGPWEWVNPPLVTGEEYRTVARYRGNPVYEKLVNFGTLPNASKSTVSHGISDLNECFYVGGTAGKYNLIGYPGVTAVFCGLGAVGIETSENVSSTSAVVHLKYTKTVN